MHWESVRRFGTLRQRLVALFVVLIGLSLLVAGTYVYFRTERDLLREVDLSLNVAATQAKSTLEEEDGRLKFPGEGDSLGSFAADAGFAYRLLSDSGMQWQTMGPSLAGFAAPETPGFVTVELADEPWRLLSVEAGSPAGPHGWIQVARSLEPTQGLLGTLRTQLYLILPIVLVLSAIAGYFLAGRALRPLVRISRTADAIGPQELDRRIQNDGPADEVGRLAAAFDRMLDRVTGLSSRAPFQRRCLSRASHATDCDQGVYRSDTGPASHVRGVSRGPAGSRRSGRQADQALQRPARVVQGRADPPRGCRKHRSW